MYLRESKQRRADGRVVTYLQLAENVWDSAKGRSQASIVHNCGRADDPDVVERLRRLAKSILRRCSPEEIVGAIRRQHLVYITKSILLENEVVNRVSFTDSSETRFP